MKKKIISLCLVIALIAIAITGATLAYFTDTDSDVNVMTTGRVEIEQDEWQGEDENGDGIPDDPFEDNKDIVPDAPVEKFVTVENTGNQDAYVRTLIAFEDTWGLSEYINAVYTDPNCANVTTAQFKATVTDADDVIVDQTIYTVVCYDYNGAVVGSDTVLTSLESITLDASATNEWSVYADGVYQGVTGVGQYNILVLSQATQVASFDAAEDALDSAFGEITSANAADWFAEVLAEELPEGQSVTCVAFDSSDYSADATVCGLGAPSWFVDNQ